MIETLAVFHFLRPWWLLALVPALGVGLWLLRARTAGSQWRHYIAPHLLEYLLDQKHLAQKKWPILALLALWCIAAVALAGPTWKKIPQPVSQSSQALVICWDLSPSMLAQDIAPSRLERARLKIIDLLHARDDGLFALVAYSGEAYNVTPLTDDTQTIINLLPALSPTYLPTVGSNPEMAFGNASELLRDAGATTGSIVFVTDGIAGEAMDFLTDAARDSPYQLTLWAVGTPQGAPIPLPGGGFAKDNSGNMVVPGLDETALQNFASRAGAYYVPMTKNDSDVSTLMQLTSPAAAQTVTTERDFDQWLDQGQYIPLLLLPFAALFFRRGALFALVFALPFTLTPPTARALDWHDLWLNQDQQAQAALERGEQDAASRFTDPGRRGAALYAQEAYDAAAAQFDQTESAIGDYNRGTALTRAGQFAEAIEAFDQALAKDPQLTAAAANKQVAEQLLALEQQQQQSQSSSGGDNEDASDQGQQQASESESGQNQPGDGQNSQAQNGSGQDSDGDPGEPGEPGEGDESLDAGQTAQNNNEQSGDEPNPYAGMTPDEQQAQQQQAQAGDAEPSADGAEQQSQVAALTGAHEGDKSEEEQQLEVMLRKVPDDPGGLLREKFKYQYLQRKQDPNQARGDSRALDRW